MILARTLGVVGVVVCAGGCSSGMYVHAVFVTCRDGTPQEEIRALAVEAVEQLSRIPSVRRVEAGTRDVRVVRDVSDTEFDVGIVVFFDDEEGYETYRAHPIHQAFVEKHRERLKAMRVFDFQEN